MLGPATPISPQGHDHKWFSDSLFVIEAENLHIIDGNWGILNGLSGATDEGYLEWKTGNPATGIDEPGQDILSYFFYTIPDSIAKPARYRLLFHSAAIDNTEHNDIWVRFPNHSGEAVRPDGSDPLDLGNDWFKVYQNEGGNRWTFDTFTVDNDPHEIYYISTEEPFWNVIQISGRSTQFKLNRIMFVHEEKDVAAGMDLSAFESICYGLPVELTHFEGLVNDQDVTLTWTTASEQNNAGFDIEFANDGAFTKIGFVPGAGTTTETQQYRFTHNTKGLNGHMLQYRLKQIDFDGAFEYSDAISLQRPLAHTPTLHKAYPNPFNPSTTLSFSLPVPGTVQLTVYDMNGRVIKQLIDEHMMPGYHSIAFQASESIPSGTYIYKLRTANFEDSRLVTLLK
ncbi:MAG: T9SS type A sorting domain-containing protein [Bacteroidota bacterium]